MHSAKSPLQERYIGVTRQYGNAVIVYLQHFTTSPGYTVRIITDLLCELLIFFLRPSQSLELSLLACGIIDSQLSVTLI